jgi:hypothetical protein
MYTYTLTGDDFYIKDKIYDRNGLHSGLLMSSPSINNWHIRSNI